MREFKCAMDCRNASSSVVGIGDSVTVSGSLEGVFAAVSGGGEAAASVGVVGKCDGIRSLRDPGSVSVSVGVCSGTTSWSGSARAVSLVRGADGADGADDAAGAIDGCSGTCGHRGLRLG